MFKHINTKDNLLSIRDGNPYVYLEEMRRKAGFAGVGIVRDDQYWKDYNEKKRSTKPSCIAIIDLNNIQTEVQIELTDIMLGGLKELIFDELPEDIAGDILADMIGLPIQAQKFIHSIARSAVECNNLGGSIDIAGYLIKLWEHVLESGFQEYMKSMQYPIEEKSILHELINHGPLGWYCDKKPQVCDKALECYKSMFTPRQHANMKSGKNVPVPKEESSWEPGYAVGSEHHVKATELYLDKVFERENWKNSMGGQYVPFYRVPPGKRTSDMHYNAKDGYWLCDWVDISQPSKDNVFLSVAKYGGWYGVDWDRLSKVARDNKEMEEYILSLRPFGNDGPRWEFAFRYLRVVVLVMHVPWDHLVRALAVLGAPGKMFKSSEAIEYDDDEFDNMGIAALSNDFLDQLVQRVRNVDDTPTTIVDILASKKENDTLYTFTMSLHNRMLGKVRPRSSAHMHKNEMLGSERNLNRAGETGMERTSGSSKVVGKNQRKQQYIDDSANDKKNHLDRKFLVGLAAVASEKDDADTTIDETVAKMLFFLEHDRFNNNEMLDYSSISARMSIVNKCTLIRDELKGALYKLYLATRKNKGNIDGEHHAPTNETLKYTDTVVKSLVESGDKFFIQAAGSANPLEPTNADKSPFIMPEDGAELKNRKGKTVVRFRRKDFLPGITYHSLEDRCMKDTNGKGLTNAYHVQRFPNHALQFTEGTIEYPGREITYLNSLMVVEAYFVPISKAKTPTGRDKNTTKAEKQAEYVQTLPETLKYFRRNHYNLEKLQQKHLVVLLWQFGKYYIVKQHKFTDEPGKPKFSVGGLRDRLNDAMTKDPTILGIKSWSRN